MISNTHNIDDEWEQYLQNDYMESTEAMNTTYYNNNTKEEKVIELKPIIEGLDISNCPPIEPLYISTKTKTLCFNQEIDTYYLFWKLPIINYGDKCSGIVNKHMQVVCRSQEEFDDYCKHVQEIPTSYTEKIICDINVQNKKRTVFNYKRKIIVGICKKDIMNARKKAKKAFMNSFAIMIRFCFHGEYREIHVKIFNTGKLEITGIQSEDLLNQTKTHVLDLLRPYMNTELELAFVEKIENICNQKSVLINSNFQCGYFIDRENIHTILRVKYNIDSTFDPSLYPGLKCRFYYKNDLPCNLIDQSGQILPEDAHYTMKELKSIKKYTIVTFTIFRTGSCLISGSCHEDMIELVYVFLCNILRNEYVNICASNIAPVKKEKIMKLRKQIIRMTKEHYDIHILPKKIEKERLAKQDPMVVGNHYIIRVPIGKK